MKFGTCFFTLVFSLISASSFALSNSSDPAYCLANRILVSVNSGNHSTKADLLNALNDIADCGCASGIALSHAGREPNLTFTFRSGTSNDAVQSLLTSLNQIQGVSASCEPGGVIDGAVTGNN